MELQRDEVAAIGSIAARHYHLSRPTGSPVSTAVCTFLRVTPASSVSSSYARRASKGATTRRPWLTPSITVVPSWTRAFLAIAFGIRNPRLLPHFRILVIIDHAPVYTPAILAPPAPSIAYLFQQRLRVDEVARVEAFGEPGVERGEEGAGFLALALALPEPRQGGGGAQLERLGLLPPGDLQGLAEERLRLLDRIAVDVEENLGPQPVQLGLVE